jgi:L-arabinonolactonase
VWACALESQARLGESPVWCPVEQCLWWVDSRGPALHRFEPATGRARTWPLPEDTGSLALRAQGGVLLALRASVALLDLETGALTRLSGPGADRPDTRFNDGKCDRRGRFWVGTMSLGARTPVGALFRLEPDFRWHRLLEGITVSNGLAWSPDDRTLYFTDTPARVIWAFDFDLERGRLGRRRLFATVPEGAGYPDGATVDAEGCLWSAHFDGWRVTRYAPDGRVDRVVPLPVQRPTSCAFGGRALDVLYVTTARLRLDPEGLRRQPLAGALLALDVGVRGLPEARFAG